MIDAVSLRLLYLIFRQVLGSVLLMGRTSSTENVELLVLRHADGPGQSPCCGPTTVGRCAGRITVGGHLRPPLTWGWNTVRANRAGVAASAGVA
jgi:hypothetical protein